MTSLKEMLNQFKDIQRDTCDQEILLRAADIIDHFDTGIRLPERPTRTNRETNDNSFVDIRYVPENTEFIGQDREGRLRLMIREGNRLYSAHADGVPDSRDYYGVVDDENWTFRSFILYPRQMT